MGENGAICAEASRETMATCDETESQREEMIEFASSIQTTLTSLKDDPNALGTITEITSGAKVREAMEPAKGLDTAAQTCVEKSIQMVDSMEQGMVSLPPIVQKTLESMSADEDDEEEHDDDEDDMALVEGLETDVEDVMECIEAIKDLNLSTALKVGMQAFSQLSDKAIRSKSLFNSIKNFAQNVTYGSEFVAARTATEQIIDLRYTLRMLGVPLDDVPRTCCRQTSRQLETAETAHQQTCRTL